MGNKFNLLPQMLPYFPKDINTFYDLFGGSATVSMNVKAKKYVVNDLNNHIYNLYEMFKNKSADEIIYYCEQMRDNYGFTKDIASRKIFVPLNKEPFYKCRDYLNENPSTLGYYFLSFYSFCNQFRFSKGKLNISAGNGYFKDESKILIKDTCSFFIRDNVLSFNKSYNDFTEFELDSFVYMDVPYCNTNAMYNGETDLVDDWNEESDYEFFRYCEMLNEKGIKFAISNVFCNKGKSNDHLKEWCEKNKWIVHHLNMKYASHGVDTNETDEVLICNHEYKGSMLF